MSNTKISLEAKKDLAKLLYTREQLDGKIVAKRVGVSEKTISKWVNLHNWKDLRNRLIISKDSQLNLMFEQLEQLNNKIKDSEEGFANSKQADILSKYASAIKTLQSDLGIEEIVESGIGFIKHVQKTEPLETVNMVLELWNSFLQAKIKS